MDGGDGSEPGARREDCGEWAEPSASLLCVLPAPASRCSRCPPQTCGHRYQRRLFVNTSQESRDIMGRCYVLSQNLTINEASEEDGGNWNFCEGRGRGHERFGYCQMGLAATFTKDYHYVVFGAPGTYNWKGACQRAASQCRQPPMYGASSAALLPPSLQAWYEWSNATRLWWTWRCLTMAPMRWGTRTSPTRTWCRCRPTATSVSGNHTARLRVADALLVFARICFLVLSSFIVLRRPTFSQIL